MRYLPLLFLLASCAPLTELQKEERAYSLAVAKENWYMCNLIYENKRLYTVHYDHSHSKRDEERGLVRVWDYRMDLRTQDCRRILGDAWAER